MYILGLLIFAILPTLLLWLFNFKPLWKYKRTLLYAIFFALIFSIPWDIYAVRTDIWSFPKEGNVGIYLLGLPLEEYFFMALVTLLIGSMTIVLKYRFKRR